MAQLMQAGVVILAMFAVPTLMTYIPDFDPLMMIIGLFVVMAAVQQLGFQLQGGQAADGDGPHRRGQPQQEDRSEPTPEEMLRDAERASEQNSWARVEELCRRVTGADPENARAWELLATAQKWDGRRDEAAATVRKARELYEVESEHLRTLEKELSQAERPGAASAECEAKGEDFFAKRQYDLATECYTKAVDALGDSSGDDVKLRLLRRRAECSQQLQDWSSCRRDATVVLEADPNDAKALLMRAAANEALEKFSAALSDARKLLSIDPRSSVANRIVHNCQQALRT
mmetsp:Transcript_91309/g.203849  ORF Transcript_91309/g.203849 Transcript_91309/m.203849 type:complete len:289 (-) Transcript_91309:361-1227(-)